MERLHATLTDDEKQSVVGQAVDNMFLVILMMLSITNSKYQTQEYIEQLGDNSIENNNEYVTNEFYTEDEDDMEYEVAVKTENDDHHIKPEKTDILGPHFIVLSESAKRPQNQLSPYNRFSRRQGMMEGIVGALGTTR